MGLLLGSYFSADTLSQFGLWFLAALLVSAYVVTMTVFFKHVSPRGAHGLANGLFFQHAGRARSDDDCG